MSLNFNYYRFIYKQATFKMSVSSYEQQRLKNIEENKRMLESLGLLRSVSANFLKYNSLL